MMTTDNRMTNQFTDEQIEAACVAYEYTNYLIAALRERAVSDSPAHTLMREAADALMREAADALEAAAGVAPQAPEGRELDALRALIENRARVIEGFSGAPAEVAAEQKAIARSIRRDLEDHDFEFRVAPVQPSSTVDEDALAEVIRRSYENEQGLKIRDDKRTARAVAEWLRGESR